MSRGILSTYSYSTYERYVGTDQGPVVIGKCMDLIAELSVLDWRIQDIINNDGSRKTTSLLGVEVNGTKIGNSWDSILQGIYLWQIVREEKRLGVAEKIVGRHAFYQDIPEKTAQPGRAKGNERPSRWLV